MLGRLLYTGCVFAAGIALGAVVALVGRGGFGGGQQLPPFAVATPDARPAITVVFSSALVAALIQRSVRAGNAPLSLENVRAGIDSGHILVTGQVPILGRRVDASVTLTPFVDQGRLHMKVAAATLGPVPVPGDLPSLAERPIDDQLDGVLAGLHASVTSVTAANEELTVTARVDPNAALRLRP